MANQVLKITFLTEVQSNLFRNAEFIKHSVSHDAYVNGSSVEIPQAGTNVGDVTIDTGDVVLPLPVQQRTDGKRTYALNNIRIHPTVVENSDELETSYQKAADVISSKIDRLNQEIGDMAAHNWSVDPTVFASRIVRTTGTASSNATPTGSTGDRLSLSTKDLSRARAILSNDDVPETDGFYCLMSSNMYWDFIEANPNVLNSDYMNKGNLPMGVVARIHGWYILIRSETARYNAGATVRKALGAAKAADDNGAAVCWHKNYVAKAEGSTQIFSDTQKADYQGDIYSGLVRFQNVLLRNDGKGVVTIVQGT